jgi:hypothetical protein
VALRGIANEQNGHSLVIGAAAAACGWRAIRSMSRTSKKRAKATMMKPITVLRKTP